MTYTRYTTDALGRFKPVVQWYGNLTEMPLPFRGDKKPPHRERRAKGRAQVIEFHRRLLPLKD
jgi:hypothetical protein